MCDAIRCGCPPRNLFDLSLFDTIGDMFIVTNMKMNIVSVNGAATRLLEYNKEDVVNLKVLRERLRPFMEL